MKSRLVAQGFMLDFRVEGFRDLGGKVFRSLRRSAYRKSRKFWFRGYR